jgi:MoaA/NifB/PqqE/SkfB family radical SAM enzyme
MKEIIQGLKKWEKGETAPPYGIELAPTLKCSINCLFCWREGTKNIDYTNELGFEDYNRVIEEAAGLGVKEIKIIGGGDALCKERIIDIMCLIKDKKMFGYICTNGLLFKENDIKRLVEKKWDHIKFSFHAPDEKTNDKITRCKGSFKKIIDNIKIINKYKKDKPRLEFGIVLINKNYKKIKKMIELAHELSIESVFIEPITVYSKLGEKLRLNKKQMSEFSTIAREAHKLAKECKIETNLQYFYTPQMIESTNNMDELILKNDKKDFVNAACFEPFYRMGIRVDGKVGPCGFFDEESPENVKNKNLKEVWYGDYFNNLRTKMINKDLPKQCRKCCTTLIINNQEIRKKLVK